MPPKNSGEKPIAALRNCPLKGNLLLARRFAAVAFSFVGTRDNRRRKRLLLRGVFSRLFHPVSSDCFHNFNAVILSGSSVILFHVAESMTAWLQCIAFKSAAYANKPRGQQIGFVFENIVVHFMEVEFSRIFYLIRHFPEFMRMGQPFQHTFLRCQKLVLMHCFFLAFF